MLEEEEEEEILFGKLYEFMNILFMVHQFLPLDIYMCVSKNYFENIHAKYAKIKKAKQNLARLSNFY